MNKTLLPVCFFLGHDNATEKPGTFLIKCRRCGVDTPYTYFRRVRSIPYRVETSLVRLANLVARRDYYPGAYWPKYRAIDQQIKGIGTKHSCASYSYEHIQSLLKQYEDDGLPEPLLKDLISEEGWIDLEEHPEMAEQVIEMLNKDLTLEATRREQEELNKR
jgi:hypothetical protein